MEAEQHTSEKPTDPKRNQKGNKNMHRNKWKWKTDNPKPMGFSKSSAKRKVHRIQAYLKKKERNQINYLTLQLKNGEGNGTPLQYSCLKIPWTEEPGGLQSTGLQSVGHNWATSLLHFTSLVSWGKLILLWTFPLVLLLLNPIGFGLSCFHVHLFLCIFWFLFLFLLWFVGYSAECCSASIC